MKRFAFLLAVVASVGGAGRLAIRAAAVESGPRLDVPKGWRTEDTPYPPPWARSLPWKGDLEIRFPPGWFEAESPYFWSYPVLYRLEGDVLLKREEIEKALRAYDAGLYGRQFDGSRIRITMGEDQKTEKLDHDVVRRSIEIDGYDPFVTRKALTTHIEIFRWYCPKSRRTVVLILRSPRPCRNDDRVWVDLLSFWKKFSCHSGDEPN